MKRLALTLFSLLLIAAVQGQTVPAPPAMVASPQTDAQPVTQINWNIPTSYADGVAMPNSDIASITITWAIEGTSAAGTITLQTAAAIAFISAPCGVYDLAGSYTTTKTAHVPSMTSAISPQTFDTGTICPFPVPPSAFMVIST